MAVWPCGGVAPSVTDQGPQDVDASAGEGEHGLDVLLPFGAFRLPPIKARNSTPRIGPIPGTLSTVSASSCSRNRPSMGLSVSAIYSLRDIASSARVWTSSRWSSPRGRRCACGRRPGRRGGGRRRAGGIPVNVSTHTRRSAPNTPPIQGKCPDHGLLQHALARLADIVLVVRG